ncbi:hypothetical protein RCL1_005169 [Eukaryota sp. TZLM3-RCL]
MFYAHRLFTRDRQSILAQVWRAATLNPTKQIVLTINVVTASNEIRSKDLGLRLSAQLLVGLTKILHRKTEFAVHEAVEADSFVRASTHKTTKKSRSSSNNNTIPAARLGFLDTIPDPDPFYLLETDSIPQLSFSNFEDSGIGSIDDIERGRRITPTSTPIRVNPEPLSAQSSFSAAFSLPDDTPLPAFNLDELDLQPVSMSSFDIPLGLPDAGVMDLDLPMNLDEVTTFEPSVGEVEAIVKEDVPKKRKKLRSFEGDISIPDDTLRKWINSPNPKKRTRKPPLDFRGTYRSHCPNVTNPLLIKCFEKGWEWPAAKLARLLAPIPDEDDLEPIVPLRQATPPSPPVRHSPVVNQPDFEPVQEPVDLHFETPQFQPPEFEEQHDFSLNASELALDLPADENLLVLPPVDVPTITFDQLAKTQLGSNTTKSSVSKMFLSLLVDATRGKFTEVNQSVPYGEIVIVK